MSRPIRRERERMEDRIPLAPVTPDALVERLRAHADWAESIAGHIKTVALLRAAADRIEALMLNLDASRQEARLMRAAHETATRSDVHQRIEARTAERDYWVNQALAEKVRGDEAVAQIDKLAQFIMDEVPGEPSQSEGAVDTAIRVIRAFRRERDEAREVVRKYHKWLERHDNLTRPTTPGGPRRGYIGLDHEVGENVEGCEGCALLSRQEAEG